VDCDLTHFAGIVACGIDDPHLGVTSLADLGVRSRMADVDAVLRREFEPLFGPTVDD
jgi:lipoyl(octanoyl) transferase